MIDSCNLVLMCPSEQLYSSPVSLTSLTRSSLKLYRGQVLLESARMRRRAGYAWQALYDWYSMFLQAVVVSLFWIVRWKHKRINIWSGCPLPLCALLFFASRNWLLSKCQTKLIADNRTEQVWPLLSEPCRAAERLVNRSRRLFSECLLLFLNEQDRNATNELNLSTHNKLMRWEVKTQWDGEGSTLF